MDKPVRHAGAFKWFSMKKGYGFIEADAGGDDVFVHISALQKSGMQSANEGDRVEYELAENPRTRRSSAVNLKRI